MHYMVILERFRNVNVHDIMYVVVVSRNDFKGHTGILSYRITVDT